MAIDGRPAGYREGGLYCLVALQTAARFADQYATGLRAGDALHLAIASRHGTSLHTLDKRLVEIGQALGVDTALVGR